MHLGYIWHFLIIGEYFQTDFVSKNPDFLDFSKQVADMVIKQNPSDVPALNNLPMAGKTVEGTR
jgi:elongation factor Ts